MLADKLRRPVMLYCANPTYYDKVLQRHEFVKLIDVHLNNDPVRL